MSAFDKSKGTRRQIRGQLLRLQAADFGTMSGNLFEASTSNSDELVHASNRLINFYRLLPGQCVDWIAESQLPGIAQLLEGRLKLLFEEVAKFNPKSIHASKRQNDLVDKLSKAYEDDFSQLHPLIAFGVASTASFGAIEAEGDALLKRVSREHHANQVKADRLFERMNAELATRTASAQADHFSSEATRHLVAGVAWLVITLLATALVAACAIVALFIHKSPWLAPGSLYEAIQLAVGKVVVLASVGSFAVLAGRQYAANRHNEVVNRHRCNALRTYQALVEAAGDQANKDIVLAQAAHAIFADQPTGFAKTDTSDGRSAPLVSLSNRGVVPGDTGSGA